MDLTMWLGSAITPFLSLRVSDLRTVNAMQVPGCQQKSGQLLCNS